VPVVFKGSGFYVNDYGKGGNTPKSTSESTKDKTAVDKVNTPEKNQSTNKASKSNPDSAKKKDTPPEKTNTKSNDK
jgi:hypothetical protein